MSLNVGINVVEVDGKATPSIQAAPTSVTGFSIKAQRGIPGQVARVTNWSQFVEHFGSYVQSAYGAYAVRGFFDNGGTTAYITRVVNTGSAEPTAATIQTTNGPWSLNSGDSLTFESDALDTPVGVSFVHGPARLQGSAGPFDLDAGAGSGKDINLTVNGVAGDSYQFLPGDFVGGLASATAAEVVAVLNRQFGGIQAWVDDTTGELRVRTDRGDLGASLQATGTAAADLGLEDDGLVPGTGNVAEINAVTAAEAVAVLSAALVEHDFRMELLGDALAIVHPTPGSEHWIQVVDAGDGVPAVFGFDNETHYGEDATDAGAAVASSHSFGTLTVTAGYRGQEDVGGWGDGIAVEIAENEGGGGRFDLIVSYGGREVERWTGLSMSSGDSAYAERVLNDEYAGSKFVMVTALGDASPPATVATGLSGGTDGGFPSRSAELNAFAASIDLFDLFDIQLLCCPEAHDGAVVMKGLSHCANKGDRMFIGHTPQGIRAPDIKAGYSGAFQGNRYGALYFPWIQVADPIGTRKWIPPTGHVLGTFARTERERGIWKAPAGNAARLRGALDVLHHISDDDHTNLVKSASVNAVRFISGQGIVIDSSRTLSTNSLWLFVNVRLLFNYVKSSLKAGLRWVVQEPNDEALWNKVNYNSVRPFLMGLWRRGAFGPGSPDDVFSIKVDGENNPPANIQQGIFNVEVYFYPSRPAETIVITIGQQEGAAAASEG